MRILISGGGVNYVSIIYPIWACVEIALITIECILGLIPKQWIVPYVIACIGASIGCFFWTALPHGMLYCNYILTFIGLILWFIHICLDKAYPASIWTLAMFLCKFFADSFAVITYFNILNWVVNVFCIGLPTIDALFLLLWYNRRYRTEI